MSSFSRRNGMHHWFSRRFFWSLSLVAIAAARAGLPPGPPAAGALARYEFVAPHMGTLFRIVLFAPNAADARTAAAAAFARVAELNRIMSDYDANSEVMRLGRQGRITRPQVFGLGPSSGR